MNTILLLALLLLPMAVEAGESNLSGNIRVTLGCTDNWVYDKTGDCIPPVLKIDKASFDALLKDDPRAKLRVILVDDPCLARMEEAMQAMEPFSIGSHRQIWKDTPNDAYIRIELLPGFERHMLVATKLWDESKRCWQQ